MRRSFSGWPAFGLFLAVFLIAYAPVLLTPYAFLDAYRDLAVALQGDSSWLTAARITQGRPLYALLLDGISLTAIGDIGALRYLRLVGIVGIAVLAWSVFRLFVRTGWGQVRSFSMSVILFTTLPFHVYAAWATVAFYLYAALASGLSFALAERSFGEQRRLPKWLLGAGASLALLTALTIHQPAAMFFWVFAAVILLKPDMLPGDMLRRFGWYGMIVMVGMLLGFVVYKLGLSLYPDFHARTGIVQDIPGKVIWFLCEALPNALNFVLLSPAHWFFSEGSPVRSAFHRTVDMVIAWSVCVFIVGGLMLYVRGTRKERLWKLSIAVTLLPLSYAPNLLVAENWASYRTLSSLTSVIVVYAFFAFQGYTQCLRRSLSPAYMNAVMGGIAIICGLSAMYHVQTYFVVPQVRELDMMRSQLDEERLSEVRGIYVIRPGWQDTLAPLVKYDEFGLPSSFAPWTPGPMAFLLLRDMIPDYAHLPVTHVAADGPIDPPPDSLVMDMSSLLRQAQRNDRQP